MPRGRLVTLAVRFVCAVFVCAFFALLPVCVPMLLMNPRVPMLPPFVDCAICQNPPLFTAPRP